MKTYNNFNEMFNANSNTNKSLSVFNELYVHTEPEIGECVFDNYYGEWRDVEDYYENDPLTEEDLGERGTYQKYCLGIVDLVKAKGIVKLIEKFPDGKECVVNLTEFKYDDNGGYLSNYLTALVDEIDHICLCDLYENEKKNLEEDIASGEWNDNDVSDDSIYANACDLYNIYDIREGYVEDYENTHRNELETQLADRLSYHNVNGWDGFVPGNNYGNIDYDYTSCDENEPIGVSYFYL